ncbi:glycosyltransferase [Algoriphagus sp. YJ13C]|uniref:Glycosyltransferase n=1 Tax=Algoriphagus pacificus TaxID=2811234 RepID=A0ABS3CL76_9BACT|nr:glycosyltransferase [Algoriphagus pacificus]
MKFAGFVITYQRPNILHETIQKLFSQSCPPEKLWIIDNSEDMFTQNLIKNLEDERLIYHRVGFNSGPAGAARIGLELVSNAGYDWILWGDDDDPPPVPETFEKQFLAIKDSKIHNIGQLGIVGQRFNCHLGKIIRITDYELQNSDLLQVDTISGGQCKIVNRTVIEAGVLPNHNLFYGFEELDFDLKLKKKGFKSIVESGFFLSLRKRYNRIDFNRPIYLKKSSAGLKRQYYSTRNLIYILKSNRFIFALLYQIFKNCLKSLIGFKYGFNYGKENFQNIVKGVVHGISGKLSNNKFTISGR